MYMFCANVLTVFKEINSAKTARIKHPSHVTHTHKIRDTHTYLCGSLRVPALKTQYFVFLLHVEGRFSKRFCT